jgi:hypothetical protein
MNYEHRYYRKPSKNEIMKSVAPLPTIYDYVPLGIVLAGCIGINISTGIMDITKIKNKIITYKTIIKNKVITTLNLSKPSDNNDYEAV